MTGKEFRFKHFSMVHENSSMKIGVDAVLLGAWASMVSPGRILDIGCGCGVIGMILAHRYPKSQVVEIDIDLPSLNECRENIRKAQLNHRMVCVELKFPEGVEDKLGKFDLIVSNPPYFDSGIDCPVTRREKARHQSDLSVFSLLQYCGPLLNEKGLLALIFPVSFLDQVKNFAQSAGWSIKRECRIRDNEKRPVKRVMIEFVRNGVKDEPEFLPSQDNLGKREEDKTELLTLFNGIDPTERYRTLCGDLYLKF